MSNTNIYIPTYDHILLLTFKNWFHKIYSLRLYLQTLRFTCAKNSPSIVYNANVRVFRTEHLTNYKNIAVFPLDYKFKFKFRNLIYTTIVVKNVYYIK